MERRLRFTYEVEGGLTGGLFDDEALRRGLTRFAAAHWPTSAKLTTDGALWAGSSESGEDAVLELTSGGLAYVHVAFGSARARVAAPDGETARAGLDELRSALPRAERADDTVRVTFWSYTPHGPTAMSRELHVPTWTDIERNYAAATRAQLEGLMAATADRWRGGQLMLWHGETGTGKTTALRALAREWAGWCEPHYITDPEKFFGEQADYMLSVMLESESFPDEDEEDDEDFETEVAVSVGGPRAYLMFGAAGPRRRGWRLLVLEDTGELLAKNARMQAGQGLSRFLNVVDGLIGQGLRVLVLVTTNEEVGALHPAVARPGRCAARVPFDRLSGEEADAWLRGRGEDGAGEAMTLAALYARLEGWDAVERRQATGFA